MKYIVQQMHIRHAGEGETQGTTYAPGDEIELTEKEAAAIGSNIQAMKIPEPVKMVSELLTAARMAIADGNTTAGGKPTVEAIETILGHNISAADRDRVWDEIQQDEE